MPEIKKTRNYDMFKFHQNNRKIDPTNLQNIKRSIRINNLLDFKPISVNSSMEILDGQHRFLAAKELDLEICYQVHETANDEDIILLGANQKRWTLEDYVNYHATKGCAAYKQIEEFARKNEISTMCALKILLSSNGGIYEKIRKGTVGALEWEKLASAQICINMAREIVSTIGRYSSEPMAPYHSDRCLRSLMAISRLDGYDHEEMKSKIAKVFDRIRPCRTEKDWFTMFLDIYNFGKKTNKLEE